MNRPDAPKTLFVDNIRLVSDALSLDKIVDAFGQYARADWPGKLKAAAEFGRRHAQEEAALKAQRAGD